MLGKNQKNKSNINKKIAIIDSFTGHIFFIPLYSTALV